MDYLIDSAETVLNLSYVRHEQRILHNDVQVFKRNLNDFYMIFLTIITFGNRFFKHFRSDFILAIKICCPFFK